MKMFKKLVLGLAAVALCAGAVGFAACGDDDNGDDGSITYEGEYTYNQYSNDYGVKVAVKVKDEVITSVTVLDSDYIEATDSTYWTNNSVYYDGKSALLSAYAGMTIDEVLALTVTVNSDGVPLAKEDEGFTSYGDNLLIANATQSSGRLLLAVQDALTLKTYTGEYKYENAYSTGSYYGVKVSVSVRGGIIETVTTIDSDYTEATSSWENASLYTDGKADLLAAYSGKKVSDVLALTVAIETSGEPTTQKGEGFTSYGDDLLITGATQSSGRLLLAVQNALQNA